VSDLVEIAKLGTATVVIPISVFSFNWWLRSHKGYAQSAAADFLLAVLIFDAALVVTAKDFEPFVRSAQLRPIVVYWHVVAFVLTAGLWALILENGEAALVKYYEVRRPRDRGPFPWGPFILSWMGVAIMLAFHIGFFVARLGEAHG
jgi:hypothetical protein